MYFWVGVWVGRGDFIAAVFFVPITDHRSILQFGPLRGVFRTKPGAPRND